MPRIADTTMRKRGAASKGLSCPDCKARIPSGAEQCPRCGTELPHLDAPRREGRESHHSGHATKRYVYGKRKEGLSAEVMWLLLVILLGILLILGAHLLQYMRARKLVEGEGRPPAVTLCLDLASQREYERMILSFSKVHDLMNNQREVA